MSRKYSKRFKDSIIKISQIGLIFIIFQKNIDNYVSFDQSLNEIVYKKSLVVKISTIAKYANDHDGKSMLKNIKTMGTPKELKARFSVNN